MLFRVFRFFSITARLALAFGFFLLITSALRSADGPSSMMILTLLYMLVALAIMGTLAGLHAAGLSVLRCPHCGAPLAWTRMAKGRHWLCEPCGIDLSELLGRLRRSLASFSLA